MINTDNKKIVESLNIPIIDSGRKYWFIRTDSGHLYEEFRNDGYIAIGFNEYVNPKLFEDLAPEDEYNLKEEIKEKFGNVKFNETPDEFINKYGITD